MFVLSVPRSVGLVKGKKYRATLKVFRLVTSLRASQNGEKVISALRI